jgi:abhydrolase domain-containing protein 17
VDARKRRWIKRWVIGDLSLRRLATSVVFIYGSLCAIALLFSSCLIYRPHPAGYTDSAAIVKLPTANGARISVRFTEVAGARYAVLYSHGNAEDLDDLGGSVDRLTALGLSVLTYDYEGYGTSEGEPSERHLYDDIDAAYGYLIGTRGILPGQVLLYGRSLGGGPTIDLASRKPVGGVLLESAFMSAFRVVTRVRLLPWDEFENLSKMGAVRCPVLVMHGTADSLIPLAHGRALFDAARGPKRALWVDGAHHNDVSLVAGARYEAAIVDFLAALPPAE